MASFVTDLAKPYVEKLINGAIAESSYICCFTCIAKDFEEEKIRLEVERKTVKQRVDVATRRGEDVQGNALFWEEEAEKLIQEDTRTTKKCFFGFCSDCIWRYRRGKELANKQKQIKILMETGKELAIGLPARLPDVERYSSQHYIPFKSRESKYKELLDALTDENNYIIGLKGMGGTGKTTLAKAIGKELKQSEQFTHVIDTTVSCSPDIKKIQDDIAGPLGLKLDDCSESDRPKKLWSRLTKDEKILLILDDVWGDIDFDEIGIPYSDNHKGSRILVTTRNMLVCNRLCSKTIQLDLLSEKDAWIMFKSYAGLSDKSTKNLLDKGRKIANECKRLPVAIAAIASSLKGEQRLEEWDAALNSLQKHMPMHGVDAELVKIYKCLKFSYDNLKNEKAKRIFLMCSVFREDEEIPTERLTRLGIGAGLFGEDYGSYEDARSQVLTSKNKLIDSCLLLEAGQSEVKMHDLVRDAAQWLANKEIQTIKLSDKNQRAMVERENNIKYLLCEGKLKDVFSCKIDGSKLEILTLFVHKDEDCDDVKIEVPNSFFENNTGLQVFHLFYNHFHELALSLPQSIQSLKNIRSLLFKRVNLGDISIFGNLQSLETLDLDDCIIDELPHGITKLEKFRLLNLECCKIVRNNPFKVIERCSSLQELYFMNSFNEFCREITFPKLQRFCIDEYWDSVNGSSSKYVYFEDNDEVFLSETTLKYCMQTAEILRLRRIEKGWRNLIPEIVPVDQGMNDLVELNLSFISQLRCLIDSSRHTDSQVPNVFSKLVVLKLNKMENLEELCNGPLSFEFLKSLEKLSIKGCERFHSLCNLNLCNLNKVSLKECPMLISLFQVSTVRCLVLLEILEIIDCRCLEYIVIDERKREEYSRGEIVVDDDDIDSKSRDSMFPKLKVLKIEKCPELELILSTHDLPALESITLKRCDKLKYKFDQYVKLGSLKKMELDGLSNLIDISPECYGTMTSSIKGPSSVSRDASKPQKQSDPIKCNIFSWTMSTACTKTPLVSEDQPHENLIATESNSYCLNTWEQAQCLSRQSHNLCNIKMIKLCNISKIKSVFILSIAPIMLLETLTIKGCDELKHIIIDTGDHDSGSKKLCNVFPKLKSVYIEDCVQLEYIFGDYTDHHQNQCEIHLHLSSLECLSLCNLPNFVAMSPKQYYTTFPPLKELVLKECSQFANVKSIGDFISHHSVARSVDSTIMKELSGNMEHFLGLESLKVYNSKVENIFFLNEENGQQMNLGLQYIQLCDLLMMKFLFVGANNAFALKNLRRINIVRCEKLEIVFSTSILRFLPQLRDLRIEECKELKHIIEDDDSENKKSSDTKTCFLKLNKLVVIKCNKLKYVFPISICKELPELNLLVIREADELEKIFAGEGDDQKVEIPKLRYLAFLNLPSLCQTQEVQFEAVKDRFVQNCKKLSITTALTPKDIDISHFDYSEGFEFHWYNLYYLFLKESKCHDTSNKHPSNSKTTEDFAAGIEVQVASEHELTSSQELMNEKSLDQQCMMDQQHSREETDCRTSSQEDGDGQIATTSFSIATTESNDQVSLNDDVAMKVSSVVEQQFPKEDVIIGSRHNVATTESNDQVSLNDDVAMKVSLVVEQRFPNKDEIIVSKSWPSSIASQFPSKPSEGDSSHIVEDSSSSLLVTRELEQLVVKKHLDHENLSLLTDFFIKHPYVVLKDTSLSNRYKGYAYNCLSELLKFLQTHSVLDVSGSSHSEFVELLQDVRKFSFDKKWLNGVENHALFPGLQVSEAALQKLLDSKQMLTQHVEDLKHQLASSEAVLESIIQQEAQILETRAAITDPIGF
ncbi:uncharacterized protein LOC123882159 isoform X2 [Trifolium pratense]|uniref:uncharacterized protein LOC123882159 isoform X2 n=1 Tax=Trifolium pratense TaxID=57577 RepID=UPI001E6951FA|nr:uncharacterized protein LOC123882159 isoform X2 [Trifolium pratense]